MNDEMLKKIDLIKTTLRQLDNTDGTFKNIKRIKIYKIADAIKKLSSLNYENNEVKDIIDYLLEEGIIFKVIKLEKESNAFDITLTKGFTIHDRFIFEKEDYSWVNFVLIILFALIVIGFALTLYVPYWYAWVLYYLKYPILAFLFFLLVAAVVRWIVYLITLVLCNSQLWIWPNLFADCGFFDSFVPTYEWVQSKVIDEKVKEE